MIKYFKTYSSWNYVRSEATVNYTDGYRFFREITNKYIALNSQNNSNDDIGTVCSTITNYSLPVGYTTYFTTIYVHISFLIDVSCSPVTYHYFLQWDLVD